MGRGCGQHDAASWPAATARATMGSLQSQFGAIVERGDRGPRCATGREGP